ELGGRAPGVLKWLRQGESLGLSLFRENIPEETRKSLLGHFVSDELADSLDRHYKLLYERDHDGAHEAEREVSETLSAQAMHRRRAQRIGALAMGPFIAMLILHGFNHHIPLFLASLAGFIFAVIGIAAIPKMRALAMHEARAEYAEYYFLFPLFL